ncbi:MAG: sterol desaturase family protein [Gammaproteobacteria bacterium]|nr:sterol desaturase family protein [Gammaproteobacteria bacterium]
MNVALILLAISPIFFVCIAWEVIKHRRHYQLQDSIANTALALMHQGSDAVALFLLMPFFYWLHQFRLFEIELNVWTLFTAFLLQDFLYYWFHRASHNIHWLWAAHVVHHSSTKMNFTTAFRQSLMYPIAGMWVFWMPMILLGFEPNIVFSVVALNLAFQFFVHTQTVGQLGVFEKVFNTPSHHRVHHATNEGYIDRNYAGVLIIWDKLFSTYAQEDLNKPITYGIVGQINSNNPLFITFHQWQYLLAQAKQQQGLVAKLKVLFAYPTIAAQTNSLPEPAANKE